MSELQGIGTLCYELPYFENDLMSSDNVVLRCVVSGAADLSRNASQYAVYQTPRKAKRVTHVPRTNHGES